MSTNALLWVALALGGIAGLVAIVLSVSPFWKRRRLIVPVLIAGMTVATGCLLVVEVTVWSALFALVTLYQVINLLRVMEGRMFEQYLQVVVRRSFWWLGGLQAGAFAVLWYGPSVTIATITLFAAQVLVGMGLLISTFINMRRSKPGASDPHYAHADLPTVTVAIPARNETDDLVACLQSVLASDYPKLEVLVLDDCSQTKTSDIIKQFAQDGVRFINGQPPRDNWLAKNQAYDTLAESASGKLVLFCGVDIRFEQQSISRLVTMFLDSKLQMLDVLPARPVYSPLAFIIQPMRYWWELAVPRFFMKQPPSLNSCWLIDRKTLQGLGGFDAVSRRVRPETYFARELYKQRTYKFILNTALLGVTNLKKANEQFDTAIRVRYPDMHKRPEAVLALTLFEVFFLLMPFAQLWYGLIAAQALLIWSAVTVICLLSAHIVILYRTNNPGTLAGIFNYPLAALTEVCLVNMSMWRYEFGTVEWKGRNICLPVMHVVPRLPNSTPGSEQKP